MGEPLTPDELADVRRHVEHGLALTRHEEAGLLATVDAERARAEGLQRQIDAGLAFHNLAVKERDYERTVNDRLRRERAAERDRANQAETERDAAGPPDTQTEES